MKYLFVVFILLVSIDSYSQPHFLYTYDAAGNRVQRKYLLLRIENPEQNNLGKESENSAAVKVFPNPTTGEFTVSVLGLEDIEDVKIYLSDSNGKLLLETKLLTHEELINISTFKSGVYYLRIFDKSMDVSYKIIKSE